MFIKKFCCLLKISPLLLEFGKIQKKKSNNKKSIKKNLLIEKQIISSEKFYLNFSTWTLNIPLKNPQI